MEAPAAPERRKLKVEGLKHPAPISSARSVLDEAICEICKKLWTNPVTLECGHNFCRACIIDLCKRRKTPSCPQCNATFQKRTFKSNQLLGRLVQTIKEGLNPETRRATGNVCAEHGKELAWFCKKEAKSLCAECKGSGAHRSHGVIPMAQAAHQPQEEASTSSRSEDGNVQGQEDISTEQQELGGNEPGSHIQQCLPQAPRTGTRQWPRWPQVTLGVGNIILVLAVLLVAVFVFQLVSKKEQSPADPNSHGVGSGDTATPPGTGDICTLECSTCLQSFRSQLTQSLCHPAWLNPAGSSACKLCPADWRLHGDKCYWVSRDSKTWSESRTDCSARGSQLLMIRDREELEFLKDLTQGTNYFWIGLSIPSLEKAWSWLDGSRLDLSRFPVLGQAEGNSCGAVKGNQIRFDTCSSTFRWICQRDAFLL